MLALDEYTGKNEAPVVRRLIGNALAQKWLVSVNDGEEWTVRKSKNRDKILEALATTGEDVLRFHDSEGNNLGMISLIYQGGDSDGEEVISDHTDNESMNHLYRLTFPA